jgi:hypothetical protein
MAGGYNDMNSPDSAYQFEIPGASHTNGNLDARVGADRPDFYVGGGDNVSFGPTNDNPDQGNVGHHEPFDHYVTGPAKEMGPGFLGDHPYVDPDSLSMGGHGGDGAYSTGIPGGDGRPVDYGFIGNRVSGFKDV